jgi:hypothetical protein
MDMEGGYVNARMRSQWAVNMNEKTYSTFWENAVRSDDSVNMTMLSFAV